MSAPVDPTVTELVPAAEPPEFSLTPSLRASNRDGAWAAVMLGIGETYLSAFGIFLQATTFQIALLATLPQFIGALFQGLGLWSMKFFPTRRPLIVYAAATHAASFLPLILLAILAAPGQLASSLLIVCVTLYYIAANVGAPAWNSLLGDLVPGTYRARYFGTRNTLIGITSFIGVFAGGKILEVAKGWSVETYGFACLFLIAGFSRLMSTYYLSKYDDPAPEVRPGKDFSLWQFLYRAPRSNFAQFVLFFAAINAAVSFGGPFFSVYLLRDANYSYLDFTIITAATTMTQFAAMQHWGKIIDQIGNKKIFSICAYGVAVAPLCWAFTHDFWILLVVQIFHGFMWAGFNLAAANFLFDAVTPSRRARCAAYQAIVNGAFVLVGSMSGGLLAGILPRQFEFSGFSIQFFSALVPIFFLSALLRLIAARTLLPRFKDARAVPHVGNRELFYQVTHFRAMSGLVFGIITPTVGGKKKTKDDMQT